jgi:hypothetical protein
MPRDPRVAKPIRTRLQIWHRDDFEPATVDLLFEADEGGVACSFDGGSKDEGDGAERGEVLLEFAAMFFAVVGQLWVEEGVTFGGDVVEALGVADQVHSWGHFDGCFGRTGWFLVRIGI